MSDEPKRLQLNAGEAVRILDLDRACRSVWSDYLRAKRDLDQETLKALQKSGMDIKARWILVVGEDEVCLVEAPDEPIPNANSDG